MLLLPRNHSDDKYYRVGVEEPAFDPAEYAWPKIGELGVEQAAYNAKGGDDKRKENGVAAKKRADVFAQTMIAKRRREKHEKKDC
jgi:hypothetical protein